MRKANLDEHEFLKFKRELTNVFMDWGFLNQGKERDVKILRKNIEKKLKEIILVKEL